MTRWLRAVVVAVMVGLGSVVSACGGGADVDERDRGAETDDSYDPDDLDEREENQ